MQPLTLTIMDQRTLSDGDTMANNEAVDAGAWPTAELVITVNTAATGESPTLTIKHAPRLVGNVWLDFEEPLVIDLSETGDTWVHVTSFTRFIGWFVSGTLTTPAVVTFDLVAKG